MLCEVIHDFSPCVIWVQVKQVVMCGTCSTRAGRWTSIHSFSWTTLTCLLQISLDLTISCDMSEGI